MKKYIVITQPTPQPDVYVSADIVYAALDTATTPHSIVLSYPDVQQRLQSATAGENFKQGQLDVINDAVAKVWSQGYLDSTIEISEDIPVPNIVVSGV